VRLPDNVSKLLDQAAARRHMQTDALAAQIISGVVLKGSISKACAFNPQLDDGFDDAAEAGESLQV
jgi:hypothetical protein